MILDRLDALGRSQLQDLIQQWYAMVAAKALVTVAIVSVAHSPLRRVGFGST